MELFKKKMESGVTNLELEEDIIDKSYEAHVLSSIDKFEIMQSPHYSNFKIESPELLVIHWTGGTYESCVEWMLNPNSYVSCHYVVDKYGKRVTEMCSPKKKAWHAGYSYCDGFGPNVNNYSIGIEIEGPPSVTKDKWWYRSCLDTIGKIITYLKEEHNINLKYIVDHSTISYGRKQDVVCAKKKVDEFPWHLLVNMTNLNDLVNGDRRKKSNEYLRSIGKI